MHTAPEGSQVLETVMIWVLIKSLLNTKGKMGFWCIFPLLIYTPETWLDTQHTAVNKLNGSLAFIKLANY